MKRIFVLCMILLLLALPSISFADGILAFEEPSYQVIPKKSITLNPIAQDIEEKLSFSWSTEDETIAKVTQKGKVTGVSVGTTTLTCVGTSDDGTTYVAECSIVVKAPMEKITPIEKNIRLPFGIKFSVGDLFTFEPLEVVDDTSFEIDISNTMATYPSEDLSYFTAWIPGESTITVTANDGSNVKGKINVSVPDIYIFEEDIIIDTPEPYVFMYQQNPSGDYFIIRSKKGIFTTENVSSDEEDQLKSASGLTALGQSTLEFTKLVPLKAGTEKISYRANGKKRTITVTVEHSAVIDQVSYPEFSVQDILNQENEFINANVSISCEIYKPDDERAIVYAKDGDDYLALTGEESIHCNPGNSYLIYGTITDFIDFQTQTGLTFRCPLIEVVKVE